MVSSRRWEASRSLLLLLPGHSPQQSWVPVPVSWRKPAQRGYMVDLKSQDARDSNFVLSLSKFFLLCLKSW